MRVAVFTNQFPGPVSTFFARDIRGLLEAGVEVDVFPLYPLDRKLWKYVPKILDASVFPRNRVHHMSLAAAGAYSLKTSGLRAYGGLLQMAGLITAKMPAHGLMPVLKSLYSLAKTNAWSREFQGRSDHILAYWGNYSATCAYAHHRMTGGTIPYSMILHAGIDLYRERVLLREKMLAARNIFVVCDFNRRFIQDHFPDIFPILEPKIRVHHLGLDLDNIPFKPAVRHKAKIIAVGRLSPGKGFDYLLRAASMLRQRNVTVQVEIVGNGPQLVKLKALADTLGITGQVTFRGWLQPDAVPGAIRSATLLVHSCHWQPGGDLDAVPTVIKEALAVGTPVIASDVAGIPELLDDGRAGVLVPPGDVDRLSSAIAELVHDEKRRSALADAGRKHAELHFDLWRNTRALAEALRATSSNETTSFYESRSAQGLSSAVEYTNLLFLFEFLQNEFQSNFL
jgi:glycosyltransferase involved in cell wall biosynthesis